MSATDKKGTSVNSPLGAGGMEYNFRDIEKKWQQNWKETNAYKVSNESNKPKYYVLDMFPYPSGAGLHVGHPLGYIASDIYARYKRLKGFNVLHPMGYDAFGLPAEQYAIDHGIHPAVSTDANIKTFRKQLDNIGFCYDWDREVRTSDPKYYKWTQWIFLQLFNSFYNRTTNKAERIDVLIAAFEKEGNASHLIPNSGYQLPVTSNPAKSGTTGNQFTADEWKAFDEFSQQDILMQYRLAYCGVGEVNWCEALGTVLANDEVVNGVSERGGYPVVKKKLRQWYLRITEYADRLLEGLERVDFSEAMKEMQSNWIGKSSGAEMEFEVKASSRKPPLTPPKGENQPTAPRYHTAQHSMYGFTKVLAKEKREKPTPEESLMWEKLRNDKTGFHIRRQHIIGSYIVDFACLDKLATIEIDGDYHDNPEIKLYDEARTVFLKENGFTELRFTNEEIKKDAEAVIKKIIEALSKLPSVPKKSESLQVSLSGGDLEGALKLRVYTTRPDTIFGVDFMVIAPEHELIEKMTSAEQAAAVEEYITYVKSRSDRERQAEKKITGVFTGAYAINPFDGRKIPIWISEYVLAGYGTGAIMAVPCGDQRDFLFAKHFNIPITNIIGSHYNGEESNPTKDAVLENSDFINGMVMKDAIEVMIKRVEELGIGVRKINYRMRDAAFSRQRYWGEPFPIKWIDGVAYPLDESELPLTLPDVEKYSPGPDGEGPLANIPNWIHQKVKLAKQSESSQVSPTGGDLEGALETNTMPGYAGSSWYFLRYMDPHNDKTFCDRKVSDYWNQVDLYIGGTEHAVGHLLYSRMWTKALYDLGHIGHDEPYKKLVNQGMIQGSSRFVYRLNSGYKLLANILETHFKDYGFIEEHVSGREWNFDFTSHSKKINIQILYQSFIEDGYSHSQQYFSDDYNHIFISHEEIFKFYSKGLNIFISRIDELLHTKSNYRSTGHPINTYFISVNKLKELGPYYESQYHPLHVDVNIVDGVELNIEEFKKWRNGEYANAEFILEDGKYICGVEVEKMSKSKFNTVNPDDLVLKYGADTFRMYEMFLGPVEQSKPWDTKGIEGVHRFLKKLWRLFYDEIKGKVWNEEKATEAEWKVLHRTIKKIEDDTERFSFNTGVSGFMIAVNELNDLKCHKKEILEKLLILLTPYAPHISEELWGQLGNTGSILDATYPAFDPKYLIESSKEYPISINGKLRTTMNIALDASQPEVEKIVLENEVVKKWLDGKNPKKIIFVKGKMVNVVV